MTDAEAADHYTALAAQIKAERAQRHLHAAAPDLLAALELWAEYDALREDAERTLIVGHLKHAFEEAMEATKSAIAKAKGQ